MDGLDFKLREDVQKCVRCQSIEGPKKALGYKRDPGMYKAVLNERIKLQRDRIRPEDLGDDIDDLSVSKKAKKRLKHH